MKLLPEGCGQGLVPTGRAVILASVWMYLLKDKPEITLLEKALQGASMAREYSVFLTWS